MEYIFIFSLTSIILYKCSHERTVWGCIFAVLILSIFAGIRSDAIGSDTAGYPLEVFEMGVSARNFADLFENAMFFAAMKEIGYVFLVYITTRVFENFNWFLFITSLVVNSGMMIFLYKSSQRYSIPLWLCWLSYCFFFFNHTLALSKQPLAVSLCLVAYTLYQDRKYYKAALLLVIAITFHFSAALSLLVVALERIKSTKIRLFLCTLVLLAATGKINVINTILNTGEALARFSHYTEGDDGDLALFETLFKLLILLMSILMYRRGKILISKDSFNLIIYTLTLELALFSAAAMSAQAGRMSYYLYPFYFIYVPLLLTRCKSHVILTKLYVFSLFSFWFITIVIQGSTHSFPYEFMF